MQFFTFTDLQTKLGNDYDITDERFVSAAELAGYINDAIDDAETAIHTMHWEDKYFLTPGVITLVASTQDYILPADIYGNKLRLLFYDDGSTKYPVRRIKDLTQIPFITSAELMRYIIFNSTANAAPKVRFYPTPTVSGAYMTCWYIRNMARISTSAAITNICEIPECINFVTQHVKKSIAKKTRRADLIAQEDKDLRVQYDLMLEALKEMTIEEDNLARMDLSDYIDQEVESWYSP